MLSLIRLFVSEPSLRTSSAYQGYRLYLRVRFSRFSNAIDFE